MATAAIETRDLTKFYGRSRGIEGLDLRVEEGEVFGFLGPNGAGKTTTIRLLLDLIRPTRGSAFVCGLDIGARSLEVRKRTGYLPGELRLPEKETARGFLAYVCRLRDGRGRDRVDGLADRLDLTLDRRIGELSKGNKQKVGLIAALAHEPELLVLDEPASGLDPIKQQDVQKLIRASASAGRTVFLSSHALDQVEHVVDRVGIVRDGRLVAVEAISTLKARALRHVEVRLAEPTSVEGLDRIPGVRSVEVSDGVVRMQVQGSMDVLVKELARLPIQTLTSEEPELDEIFLAYYGRTHAD